MVIARGSFQQYIWLQLMRTMGLTLSWLRTIRHYGYVLQIRPLIKRYALYAASQHRWHRAITESNYLHPHMGWHQYSEHYTIDRSLGRLEKVFQSKINSIRSQEVCLIQSNLKGVESRMVEHCRLFSNLEQHAIQGRVWVQTSNSTSRQYRNYPLSRNTCREILCNL